MLSCTSLLLLLIPWDLALKHRGLYGDMYVPMMSAALCNTERLGLSPFRNDY
jgi:hypothetical protein